MTKPKTYIVHDWIDSHGGAERCAEAFVDLFHPEKFFTLLAKPTAPLSRKVENILQTSRIQKFPFSFQLHRYFLNLYPSLIETFDVSDADIVLSSSHCVAKGVLTRSDQLHLSYVHTPARYLWDQSQEYLRVNKIRGLKRWYIERVFHRMRLWDVVSSNRVSLFLANSENVARRIWHTYRRPSVVVHPFVDLKKFVRSPVVQASDYFVVVSRLVSQKRVDIAVEACREAAVRLKVIGNGPELNYLKSIGGSSVEFLGQLSDPDMISVVQASRGLIFTPEEDFGMVPIEAQALGIPVLAYGKGGALETVIPGKTGEFFYEQTKASLIDLIRKWRPETFSIAAMKENAERFSKEKFESKMTKIMDLAYSLHREGRLDDKAFSDSLNFKAEVSNLIRQC